MKKRFFFFFFISGLVLMNACQKEFSLENGNDPSEGTLQDDGAGDCLPKTVSGTYIVGTALTTSNYIEVQVNVTKAGSYTIYTDTVNGIYFRVTGIFTTAGLNTVRLKGNGTPGAIGINNFVVNYGLSGCTIAVTSVSSLGTFTLDGAPGGCMGAAVAGTYTAGTALTTSNNVTINVNVTAIGAYNITSPLSNGMIFSGSGVFTITGPQAIVLTGSQTPVAAGTTSIPLTAGSSACSFPVTVNAPAGAATFTVDCTTATVNGTYTTGVALTASNTITLPVTATVAGTYSIATTPVNGMTFTASGTLTSGANTVTLNPATGSTPASPGATSVAVTGGTGTCNVTVTVNPAAGAATFTVDCTTATVNGTYTAGVALTPANTITLPVTATVAGTYSIATTPVNGMTFTASGTLTAGANTVTLNPATGSTPVSPGAISVAVTGGTGTCNVTVTVNPAAGGAATFTANCATATVNGTYTVGIPLTPANTITLPVTATVAGTYSISTTAANGMTFTASGTLVLGANTVTLNPVIGSIPVTPGATSVPVTGGTGSCNVTVTVNPASSGIATFTVDCSSALLGGYLTKGVAITAANAIDIFVNVTLPGTYSVSTVANNGITYTASGTFTSTGTQPVTLSGIGSTPVNSGTFTLQINSGAAPCSFDVVVDPNYGTWTFKVGAITYSGTIYEAEFDNTGLPAPATFFALYGDDAPGNLFSIQLVDLNGTIANGENYLGAPQNPITNNVAGVYYDGVDGTTYAGDPVDTALTTNTMIVVVTSHNTATRTMTGTFSGKALLNGTTTLVDITNGTFTVTYP